MNKHHIVIFPDSSKHHLVASPALVSHRGRCGCHDGRMGIGGLVVVMMASRCPFDILQRRESLISYTVDGEGWMPRFKMSVYQK